ncbi:hypothetical protein Asi02nite_42170 [Asanoa siamensis]|uniref:Uncharacterized protein n=1 Tax=Asanoa siamensis TaxID=926357 RepID=A0ABQ4CTU8_9ACTN|nr:hypothetical protein Asi02nite_42170 [Asanoa siamensis]
MRGVGKKGDQRASYQRHDHTGPHTQGSSVCCHVHRLPVSPPNEYTVGHYALPDGVSATQGPKELEREKVVSSRHVPCAQ